MISKKFYDTLYTRSLQLWTWSLYIYITTTNHNPLYLTLSPWDRFRHSNRRWKGLSGSDMVILNEAVKQLSWTLWMGRDNDGVSIVEVRHPPLRWRSVTWHLKVKRLFSTTTYSKEIWMEINKERTRSWGSWGLFCVLEFTLLLVPPDIWIDKCFDNLNAHLVRYLLVERYKYWVIHY